jgi:hypothetical protein
VCLIFLDVKARKKSSLPVCSSKLVVVDIFIYQILRFIVDSSASKFHSYM